MNNGNPTALPNSTTAPRPPKERNSPERGPAHAPAEAPSMLQSLGTLWHELPGLVNDRIELLSLELQRAGRALAQIVVLVVAAAILGVTAWLVLWGGFVAALVHWGLALPWALGIALLVNMMAMYVALVRVLALLPLLGLPATKRHLMLGSPPPSPTASAPTQGPESVP